MYPKTISPSKEIVNKTTNNRILSFLETGQRLPLFQAGPMIQALTSWCIEQKHFDSIALEQIFFSKDGGLVVCPEKEMKNISVSSPFYLAMTAPEERLRQTGAKAGNRNENSAAAVYRLCSLFFCLLSGRMPADPACEGIVQRRKRLRLLAEECDMVRTSFSDKDAACTAFPSKASFTTSSDRDTACMGQDAECNREKTAHTDALFHLLDCGLRTEPSRRIQNPAEFLGALNAVEEAFDRAACQRFCLQGMKGALSGHAFALSKRMLLGRAADVCQVAFPVHTPGVSRIHCSVDLVWGRAVVTDLNSRYGTFLDGERLKAGKPVVCPAGQEVWCGSDREVVKVTLIPPNLHMGFPP